MSIVFMQRIISVFEDVQTELLLFVFGVMTHFIFFRVLRPANHGTKQQHNQKEAPSATRQELQRGGLFVLKAALSAGDLKTVLCQFEGLQPLWRNQASPSSAPHMLMEQIIKLAVQKKAVFEFLHLLKKMNLLDDFFDLVLSHVCSVRRGPSLVKELLEFGASEGVKMSSSAYLALLKSASNIGRHQDVLLFMKQARKAGLADAATYSAYITDLLKQGQTTQNTIRQSLQDMKADGLQPNTTVFNKLLGAALSSRDTSSRTTNPDVASVWTIVDGMKAFNVEPDQYTIAILLKSRCVVADPANFGKVISMLDGMEGDMDDVLFNSVVDACVSLSRNHLLMPFLKKHRASSKGAMTRSAHTYGSIIRAYGTMGDMRGAWDTWEEMMKYGISPSSITVGCMIEALVTNGDIDGGYELAQQMGQDEKTAGLVNAVMYGSIMKGFSHKKRFRRMWEVYDEMVAKQGAVCQDEMVAKQLKFTIVTFNTLIDACARSGDLTRIPGLLKDMDTQGVKMGIQTYGAILKGYVQKNMIDDAFELFDDITAGFKPDEILYNTLLDGCARQGLFDRGMKLFQRMEEAGVRPSNFTLSVLVKMANRGKKLQKAFDLCEELPSKYSFKLNIHVYDNLIQASVFHCDVARATGVLERMLQEGVRPDMRTYSMLLKAYIEVRSATDADGLLRAAMGLDRPHPRFAKFPRAALKPEAALPGELISDILEGLMDDCKEPGLAAALLADLSRLPGQKFDPKLRLRLAARLAADL